MRPDIPAYQVTEKMTEMQGAQAVGAWQHWMSTLYGLESDVYGDQHFSARLGTFELGPVGMTRIEASRHRVRRTSASMARHSTDFLKIVAPWHGEARVCQNGREAVARSGQWLIYDTTQEYEVLNPEWCEHLIITLPKSRFEDHGRAIDALMGRYVGGSEGVSRIALDMMRGTCRMPGHGPGSGPACDGFAAAADPAVPARCLRPCGLAERQRAAAGPHQGLCAPASARSGPERRCRGRSAQLQQASSLQRLCR
jgi:hypothetical protein